MSGSLFKKRILCDFDYKKHFRVHHSKNEFVRGNSHINGIESFWGYVKNRLVKFKGMNKSMFNLYLKVCEFRFNNHLSCHNPILLYV
jgi:transposase